MQRVVALKGNQEECDVLRQASDGVQGPGEEGSRGRGERRGGRLGEAGVGAARVAVFPLSALHHTGDLQARHHREAAVPHLQGGGGTGRGEGEERQHIVRKLEKKTKR